MGTLDINKNKEKPLSEFDQWEPWIKIWTMRTLDMNKNQVIELDQQNGNLDINQNNENPGYEKDQWEPCIGIDQWKPLIKV